MEKQDIGIGSADENTPKEKTIVGRQTNNILNAVFSDKYFGMKWEVSRSSKPQYITAESRKKILNCSYLMLMLDKDRAKIINNEGYRKGDSKWFHRLLDKYPNATAALPHIEDFYIKLMANRLIKYRRQIRELRLPDGYITVKYYYEEDTGPVEPKLEEYQECDCEGY